MTGIVAGIMEDNSIVNNADEFESKYWSVTSHAWRLCDHPACILSCSLQLIVLRSRRRQGVIAA